MPDTLTRRRILELVDEIGQQVGLSSSGAELIKFTNNAVVRLPAAGAVVRIAGSTVTRRRIPGVIASAKWFAAADIPAVRLWPELDQPVHAGTHQATVWIEVKGGGPGVSPRDLAAILLQIHKIEDQAPDTIPQWSLPNGIRQRLANAAEVDSATIDYLRGELGDIEDSLEALQGIPPLIPPGIIHGDAHLGNLIASPSGAVICDFDSTSIGRREWDLTPAAVGALRFRYSNNVHEGLVSVYGVDVTTWEGFPILRRLREFQLVTSVLPVLSANPKLRPQWEHRLTSYRSGDKSALWKPYDSSS